jgi:Fe2+ or Zn2+ uptake regulation protein
VPQSSAYRNLTVLCEAGVARRLAGTDDLGRFELAEDLTGHHHHHLVCSRCGRVDAFEDPALETAIEALSARVGYRVAEHDVVLRGACDSCA